MDIPDLQVLRTFIAVVERGSILGAAEQLQTSRARVRRHLEQLDETFGADLLRRGHDGIEPTERGADVLAHARQLIADGRALLTRIRDLEGSRLARLRVGLQVGYPIALARMLGELAQSRYPEGGIEYFVAERPADLLPDRVDAAICVGEQRCSVPYVEIELARLRQGLYASPSYLDKHGAPKDAAEAASKVLASWRDPEGASQLLHVDGGKAIPIEPEYITADENFIAAIAETSRGLVYYPKPPPFPGAPSPTLKPVLPDQVGRIVRARVLIPEGLTELPRVKLIIDTVRKLSAT